MWLLELLGEMMKAIVPPHDADPRTQYSYRVRVTVVACSTFVGLIVLWAASFGLVPTVFPGFARADELHASIEESRKHWSYDTESALLQLREQQCHAANGSAQMKSMLAESIQKRVREYQSLTGISYIMPSCNDL